MHNDLGDAIEAALAELTGLSVETRLEQRYRKFRAMGAFTEGATSGSHMAA